MDQQQASLKLIFNVQSESVTLEECWMHGYYSAQQGVEEASNPFDDSKAQQYWNDGWEAGLYGEPALFPEYAMSKPTPADHSFQHILQSIKKFSPKLKKTQVALYGLGITIGTSAIVATIAMDLVA